MIEINWHPTRKELRIFCLLQLAVCGGLVWAGWFGRGEGVAGSRSIGLMVFGLGAATGGVGLAWPWLARQLFVGWSLAAFPIGWVMSHLILAAIYYLLLTPIALLLRLSGHDRLQRRLDRAQPSYWVIRSGPRPMRDYFRQF